MPVDAARPASYPATKNGAVSWRRSISMPLILIPAEITPETDLINGHALDGSSRVMLAALKQAVRDGVLVMQAMSDLDYRWRQPLRSTWRISAPDDPNTAYAYTELKLRFVPSPRDITRAEYVDSWLVWLRGIEGKAGAHRVWHWARGAPQWLQAQREHCSERTIVNRIDRSMAKILAEFLCTEVELERVEEPADEPVLAFHGEHTSDVTGAIGGHAKVWIDGIGFMRDGRRLRDGREKIDDRRLTRNRA